MDRDNLRRKKTEENEKKIAELYDTYPDIKKIEEDIQKLSLARIHGAFSKHNSEYLKDLEEKVYQLLAEKENLFTRYGLSAESFEPDWDCKKCSDRGYLEPGVVCDCISARKNNSIIEKSGLTGEMRTKTFDNFDLSYYKDSSYVQDKVQKALVFVDNVHNNRKQKNIYLVGDVGTGKTHLSLAIANQLLAYNHTVIYKRTDDLIDIIIEYKFEDKSKKQELEVLKNADLLVIDDLGAEKISEFASNQIRIILEERSNLNKAMIINSNYGMDKIQEYYGLRISDRIIENFDVYKLETEESIRVQKKGIK